MEPNGGIPHQQPGIHGFANSNTQVEHPKAEAEDNGLQDHATGQLSLAEVGASEMVVQRTEAGDSNANAKCDSSVSSNSTVHHWGEFLDEVKHNLQVVQDPSVEIIDSTTDLSNQATAYTPHVEHWFKEVEALMSSSERYEASWTDTDLPVRLAAARHHMLEFLKNIQLAAESAQAVHNFHAQVIASCDEYRKDMESRVASR